MYLLLVNSTSRVRIFGHPVIQPWLNCLCRNYSDAWHSLSYRLKLMFPLFLKEWWSNFRHTRNKYFLSLTCFWNFLKSFTGFPNRDWFSCGTYFGLAGAGRNSFTRAMHSKVFDKMSVCCPESSVFISALFTILSYKQKRHLVKKILQFKSGKTSQASFTAAGKSPSK